MYPSNLGYGPCIGANICEALCSIISLVFNFFARSFAIDKSIKGSSSELIHINSLQFCFIFFQLNSFLVNEAISGIPKSCAKPDTKTARLALCFSNNSKAVGQPNE